MAESVDVDVQLTGDFRKRQHSFHSVSSYHLKAAKRPAATPLDFVVSSQRARFDEEDITLSVSAPISSLLSSPLARMADEPRMPSAESETDSDGSISDAPTAIIADSTESNRLVAVPFDILNNSSPAKELPVEEVEEVIEEEEVVLTPRRIVRPEDISLHNPDSGLGYRASKNDYHTDDSDDGHDDDDEEEEKKERRDGEVTDPDEFPPSHPDSPLEEHEIFMPLSPSGEYPVEEVIEGDSEDTLPFNTPLDLQLSFDPTVPMGLLMIDPSHQDRFNQLSDEGNTGFTAYETLLQQYESQNATRLEQLEHALMLNIDGDLDGDLDGDMEEDEEVHEIVEIIDEEDLPLPPANPPSSPAFLLAD